MRTGAHKCAHTLLGYEFNWETTWNHVFHHFAICLQVFDKFDNFWILCAQVRTGAHTHYSDMNSTGKQLGNIFSTTLLLACKFLTTFIIFGYCAHRCAQVHTSAHTHYSDMNSTGKQLGNMFSTTLLLACKFVTTFIIFGYCAHRCAQVRTGAHKCAHTLFRHEFNWETTWKHVFHHFATCLQVFDNFHNFWILCAQVRTGAHRCAQVRTHTIQT